MWIPCPALKARKHPRSIVSGAPVFKGRPRRPRKRYKTLNLRSICLRHVANLEIVPVSYRLTGCIWQETHA
ncbi:MAG: hypothetical protein JWP36_11 [Paucimonas sp.]|nr:hypothetical protein [Paucimonas sp.]